MNATEKTELESFYKNLIDITSAHLEIGVDVNNDFYCSLKDGWVKEPSHFGLSGLSGRGKTLEEALTDYMHILIKPKNKLVIKPFGCPAKIYSVANKQTIIRQEGEDDED